MKYCFDCERLFCLLQCPLAQKCACENGERGPSGPAVSTSHCTMWSYNTLLFKCNTVASPNRCFSYRSCKEAVRLFHFFLQFSRTERRIILASTLKNISVSAKEVVHGCLQRVSVTVASLVCLFTQVIAHFPPCVRCHPWKPGHIVEPSSQ